MNKETKQQMIDFHRTQIESHQSEIEKLTVQEKPTEQKPMFGQALRPKDAKFEVNLAGGIVEVNEFIYEEKILEQGNCFFSKESAELEAEKRRLRQLARVRMADSWDDDRPWETGFMPYCINLMGGQVKICAQSLFSPLHFPSYAEAKSFFDEVGKDGIRKILEL